MTSRRRLELRDWLLHTVEVRDVDEVVSCLAEEGIYSLDHLSPVQLIRDNVRAFRLKRFEEIRFIAALEERERLYGGGGHIVHESGTQGHSVHSHRHVEGHADGHTQRHTHGHSYHKGGHIDGHESPPLYFGHGGQADSHSTQTKTQKPQDHGGQTHSQNGNGGKPQESTGHTRGFSPNIWSNRPQHQVVFTSREDADQDTPVRDHPVTSPHAQARSDAQPAGGKQTLVSILANRHVHSTVNQPDAENSDMDMEEAPSHSHTDHTGDADSSTRDPEPETSTEAAPSGSRGSLWGVQTRQNTPRNSDTHAFDRLLSR